MQAPRRGQREEHRQTDIPECILCLEKYEEPPSNYAPVMLPCGHSVCKQCAPTLQKEEGGTLFIKCSVCRALSPLPAGGAAALPHNYTVVEMLRSLSDSHQTVDDSGNHGASVLDEDDDEATLLAKALSMSVADLVCTSVAFQMRPDC